MDCKHVQQQLSAGTAPDPALNQHIEECDDCRQFAADLLDIHGMIDSAISTPNLLREQTLDLCRTKLAEQTNGHKVTETNRLRVLVESPRFVVVTAVLSVLLLATSIVLQIFFDPAQGTNMIVKISIIQIVLQNFIAALFMPTLMMFRNRLGDRFISPVQSGD